ncbi:MAG: copper-translocating P-type ATPase [Rhodospirillales bacterium]
MTLSLVTPARLAPAAQATGDSQASCPHCGGKAPPGARFCCPGCASAFWMIGRLGLGRFYRLRDPRSTTPSRAALEQPTADPAAYVIARPGGMAALNLMIDGIQCGACVWLIEQAVGLLPGVESARVNMTTRRLAVVWRKGALDPSEIVSRIAALGYRAAPYDPALLDAGDARAERELLRAMAVAGLAAGNVMLLSVAVWAGHAQGMEQATRDLMHWVSALIAIPAVAYAGRPFFRSAFAALKARRTNMDVPISLAVILAPAMSLIETFSGGAHAYFDSAVTLLFFLLIGRFLDRRARGRARASAEQLLALAASSVCVMDAGGAVRSLPPAQVSPGMTALVPPGACIGVDGTVVAGQSDVDASMVTGESVPMAVKPGDRVFAGTLNLTGALRVAVTAAAENRLLAEIVRLMEAAERGRGRFVTLADRLVRWYSPVVHGAAALTFAGWLFLGGIGWQPALLTAIAVLIITCPCALALAVPAVQVAATGRLMRQGVLVKQATALERLAAIDTVVLDKTGTLTEGRPALVNSANIDPAALHLAASMAAASRHPLAQAISHATPGVAPADGVIEVQGAGLILSRPDGEVRLGNRAWLGIPEDELAGPELWLARPGQAAVRFAFLDRLRPDARAVMAQLKTLGLGTMILSGDRAASVAQIAAAAGIDCWRAGLTPADKTAVLARLAADGRRVLMVGDGLNDAPALAAAHASMSPASAADIAQNAADIVFQGMKLAPVAEAISLARRAARLARQNLLLALVYNLLAVPLAVVGWVTPLVAAAAMSSSSIAVIANALRVGRGGGSGARR